MTLIQGQEVLIAEATCWGNYGNQYTQRIYATLNSQNIANNTSNVTIRYTNQNTAGTSGNYGYANPAIIKYWDKNGEHSNSYTNSSTDYRWGALVTLGTWTVDVLHNDNGKLTLSLYATFSSSATSLSGGEVSGQAEVPDIPREVKIATAPNFNDEENPTITYTNSAGNSVTELKACISLTGARDDISYRDIPINGNSYTFQLTEAERNILRQATPNNNNLSVIFYVRTKIGNNTFYNTATRTMSIINGNPVFSDFDFVDINPTTVALTGGTHNNVKGYSNIRALIPTNKKATAVKSATMNKYRFVIDTQTTDIAYSDNDTVYGDISNSKLGVYNVYAIDSRNNSTLVTKNADNNIAYEPISFNTSSCKVERNNGGVGENAVLSIQGYIWNNDFGQVVNSINNVVVEYKETSSSSWLTSPTIITPTLTNNYFEFEGQVASQDIGGVFELNKSYDFRITITDELSTATVTTTPMASAIPNISLADDGVGIMCDYDENLGGDLQIGGIPLSKYPRDIDYCVATILSAQTISPNYIVDLNTIDRKQGNFTLSDKGIRIGAGINTIRVSGSIFVENWSGGNNYMFGKIIKKDGVWITTSINGNTASYVSTSMASTIIEVNEGDIIQLIADSGASGTLRAGMENTFLCVEKIN